MGRKELANVSRTAPGPLNPLKKRQFPSCLAVSWPGDTLKHHNSQIREKMELSTAKYCFLFRGTLKFRVRKVFPKKRLTVSLAWRL